MQMLYACLDGIPPEFLIGFIHQVGSKEVIKRKLRDGYIKPGFEAAHKRRIKDTNSCVKNRTPPP